MTVTARATTRADLRRRRDLRFGLGLSLPAVAVVVLLLAASLFNAHYGTAISLLFIASMISIGLGFAVFLLETRVGSRAVRIRAELLSHEAED